MPCSRIGHCSSQDRPPVSGTPRVSTHADWGQPTTERVLRIRLGISRCKRLSSRPSIVNGFDGRLNRLSAHAHAVACWRATTAESTPGWPATRPQEPGCHGFPGFGCPGSPSSQVHGHCSPNVDQIATDVTTCDWPRRWVHPWSSCRKSLRPRGLSIHLYALLLPFPLESSTYVLRFLVSPDRPQVCSY